MKLKITLVTLCFVFLIPFTMYAEFDHNSKEFQTVISQLDMQGHADDDLATCSVKRMYYDEVLTMLNEGQRPDEILQFYVDEYGQAALREPGTDANGIVAWLMPVIGLLAGILIISQWLKRIKQTEQVQQRKELVWESEAEKDIMEQIFEEERHKRF